MAFNYTPVQPQRQVDIYKPFQARQAQANNQQQQATDLMKAARGAADTYNTLNAANTASDAYQIGGTGYGLGQSLTAGELGSATYAGGAGAGSAAAGTAAGGTGSAASTGASSSGLGSAVGTGAGYAGMALNAYGMLQGMQTRQGVEGRDQGTLAGSAAAAGAGAAQGASAGGPVGAIVGAALGNESYQWQHGNRDVLTSPKKLVQSELTGGLAARDIGRWTGLWA